MIGHSRLRKAERFAIEERRKNPPPPTTEEMAARFAEIYKEANERIAAGDTDCEIVHRAMDISKILETARGRMEAARQKR